MRVKPIRSSAVVVAACFLGFAVVTAASPALAEVPAKLKEGLQNASPKVRIVAVANVAKLKDAEIHGLLLPMLKDGDAAVRAAVVDALGRMGDVAALPALEAMKTDDSETVQKVLARVMPQLNALVVFVYVGKGQDFSKAGIDDIADFLVKRTREEITRKLAGLGGVVVVDDASKKAFGAAPLVVRSITQRKDGPNTIVEVKCELTIVDMPTNILRGALASTAEVGIEGNVDKKMQAELAHDGVNACAPEIADDFASYVKEHARR